MTKRDKTTVDDIIGIVHTDEPTDSVDEVRKLRGRDNEKEFLKIIDDYYIQYDGDIFDLHKPSDIRSLIYILNRKQGFSELQCEYNDLNKELEDD